MAGRPADVLDIPRADAALGGCNPQMGRLHLPGKERFERGHSRPDQQQARIIVGNQGKTGQNQMVFPSEKLQIFLSQFISGHALTSNWPNGRILKELYTIYRTLVNLPRQSATMEKGAVCRLHETADGLINRLPPPWLFRKVQMQETTRFAP